MTTGAAIVLGLAGAVFIGLMGWLLWRVEAAQNPKRKGDAQGAASFALFGGNGGGTDCGGGAGGGDGGGG